MNCPHRINGPLNAAGAFRHCKQRGGREEGGKTAYNNIGAHVADLLGFITEAGGRIDGFLLRSRCPKKKDVWVLEGSGRPD